MYSRAGCTFFLVQLVPRGSAQLKTPSLFCTRKCAPPRPHPSCDFVPPGSAGPTAESQLGGVCQRRRPACHSVPRPLSSHDSLVVTMSVRGKCHYGTWSGDSFMVIFMSR